MIEDLDVVVVQLDKKQITQVHCVHLSVIDVEERKYVKHYLPDREN